MNYCRTKYLAKVIVFCALFFLLLFRISYILRPGFDANSYEEKTGLFGIYSERGNSLDVIAIGSSDMLVFWAPFEAWKQDGVSSYVYGKSALRVTQYEDMIDESMKKQNPKLLVIGLRPFIDADNYVEESSLRAVTDAMPYSTVNRWEMIYKSQESILLTGGDKIEDNENLEFNSLAFYFDIMKYHGNWENLSRLSWNNDKFRCIQSSTKGFLLKADYNMVDIDNAPTTQEEQAVTPLAEECLVNLLEKLENANQESIFILVPYKESEEDKQKYNYLRKIISSHGFLVIDLNESWKEMELDPTADFYNERHVNILGAEKITQYLSRYLKEQYSLPNHKGDHDYKNWEDGLANWEKEKGELKEEINSIRGVIRVK